MAFNGLLPEFKKLDTEVVGVSKDSLKSHAKFRDKYELAFPLISDEDKVIIENFGVMVPKKTFGKEYMGVERSTFLFDKDGELVKEWRKVKVNGHAEEVLEFVKNL